MAQSQEYGPYPMGGMMCDIYVDYCVIINNSRTVNDVFYLVNFDKKTNKVSWSKNIKNAKSFGTKKQAQAFAEQINRPFYIEEKEEYYYGTYY